MFLKAKKKMAYRCKKFIYDRRSKNRYAICKKIKIKSIYSIKITYFHLLKKIFYLNNFFLITKFH